eukprot:scaffold11753_cov47-Phaeocystis_antarctica.AAC.3
MRARSRSEASHASTCVATSATTASDWRAGGRMHVSSGCGPAASASPSRRTRARSGPARELAGRAGGGLCEVERQHVRRGGAAGPGALGVVWHYPGGTARNAFTFKCVELRAAILCVRQVCDVLCLRKER